MNVSVKKNVARAALAGLAFTSISLGAFLAPQAGAETEASETTTVSSNDTTTPAEKTTEVSTDENYEDLNIQNGEKEKMEYIGDEAPRGSVFTLDVKKEDIPEGWDITIDEKTGDITVASPDEVTEESIIKLPVKKTLPDGKVVKMVATITFEEEGESEDSTSETTEPTAKETTENKQDGQSEPTENLNDTQVENQNAAPSQNADPRPVAPVSQTLAEITHGLLGKAGPHTSTGGQVDNAWTWVANIVK